LATCPQGLDEATQAVALLAELATDGIQQLLGLLESTVGFLKLTISLPKQGPNLVGCGGHGLRASGFMGSV
jgi:hypothetical protein